MPDKNTRSEKDTASSAKQPAGRWKTSCAAGQDPTTGASIRRTAYGKTPQEAAVRLTDSLKEKPHTTRNALRGL